jgi:hypothetical protein
VYHGGSDGLIICSALGHQVAVGTLEWPGSGSTPTSPSVDSYGVAAYLIPTSGETVSLSKFAKGERSGLV